MRRVEAALRGVWEFVVGDDWVAAAGVVAALGLTALASEATDGWFVMPPAVAAILTASVWRAGRQRH